jgi:RNA polymerase sigma factor (sigma-70 family)
MDKTLQEQRDIAALCPVDAVTAASATNGWFIREVLPLEALLMTFLRRNWSDKTEIADLRQEVYVRVYEAAQKQIPDQAKPFVLTTARNLLINRMRREHVVPIEAMADLDTLGIVLDEAGPDRNVMAREELRRVQAALDRLPPRCREAIVMKQVDGLSRSEIATRMNVGEETVKRHLTNGMRALADCLYSESEDLRRKS